jgi:hypothetical protein
MLHTYKIRFIILLFFVCNNGYGQNCDKDCVVYEYLTQYKGYSLSKLSKLRKEGRTIKLNTYKYLNVSKNAHTLSLIHSDNRKQQKERLLKYFSEVEVDSLIVLMDNTKDTFLCKCNVNWNLLSMEGIRKVRQNNMERFGIGNTKIPRYKTHVFSFSTVVYYKDYGIVQFSYVFSGLDFYSKRILFRFINNKIEELEILYDDVS